MDLDHTAINFWGHTIDFGDRERKLHRPKDLIVRLEVLGAVDDIYTLTPLNRDGARVLPNRNEGRSKSARVLVVGVTVPHAKNYVTLGGTAHMPALPRKLDGAMIMPSRQVSLVGLLFTDKPSNCFVAWQRYTSGGRGKGVSVNKDLVFYFPEFLSAISQSMSKRKVSCHDLIKAQRMQLTKPPTPAKRTKPLALPVQTFLRGPDLLPLQTGPERAAKKTIKVKEVQLIGMSTDDSSDDDSDKNLLQAFNKRNTSKNGCTLPTPSGTPAPFESAWEKDGRLFREAQCAAKVKRDNLLSIELARQTQQAKVKNLQHAIDTEQRQLKLTKQKALDAVPAVTDAEKEVELRKRNLEARVAEERDEEVKEEMKRVENKADRKAKRKLAALFGTSEIF